MCPTNLKKNNKCYAHWCGLPIFELFCYEDRVVSLKKSWIKYESKRLTNVCLSNDNKTFNLTCKLFFPGIFIHTGKTTWYKKRRHITGVYNNYLFLRDST